MERNCSLLSANWPDYDGKNKYICGTINDLVMLGAIPEYLSLALIIEEGLEYRVLETIVDSIPLHAKKAGVHFVTGDIKTVVGTERLVDMLTSEPLPRIC